MAKKDVAVSGNSALSKVQAAIANRPSYLPAVAADDPINQIVQRPPPLPILSLNNNNFTLLENRTPIYTFEGDECKMWFLHIHLTQQRRAYEEEWDEDDPQEPKCQSDDNIAPLAGILEPESDTCGTCWRNGEDTKRSDRCSWLRNSIVLVEYESASGQQITCLARLRLNGNTLFGEEDRSSGELNAESVVREFKGMQSKLWFHPVVAFFDTSSKNARNKLLFEILLNEYPTEDMAEFIMAQESQYDYPELTRLKVVVESNGGNSSDGGSEESPKEVKQRAPAKAASGGGKKTPASTKRAPKEDTTDDDSAGSDTPARSRRSRGNDTESGGKVEAGVSDAGAAEGKSRRSRRGEPSDSGDANPLEDADVSDLIGNIELP